MIAPVRSWRPMMLLALIGLTTGCVTADRNADRNTGQNTSQRAEEIYLERWNAQQAAALEGGGLASYDPLETVTGARATQPLPTAPGTIAPAALTQARDYAATRNSTSLLVWHKGALVGENYFAETTRETLINAKSLAKPLTAIVIGRAIAQGHIQSLDQPVANFITEWQDDPDRSKILVRHLLDMRSGLLAQGIPSGPEDPLARAYLHPRHDEVIIEEYPLINPPGTRYDYANANSELVAPLIERATGLRYGEYVGTQVLAPIGAAGGNLWLNRPGGMAHSGCCILLPAHSWMRLALLLLRDGKWEGTRLLPQGYVAAMRTTTPQNPHAGLGVWAGSPYIERRSSLNPDVDMGRTLHSEPYAAEDLFLFDGNGHQTIYIVPSLDLIVMRTGSYPSTDKAWDNSVLPNRIIAGIEEYPIPCTHKT